MTQQQLKERPGTAAALETRIEELQDVYNDISQLVDLQSEALDKVEVNVSNAADFIESAKDNMREASQYRSKARSALCCYYCVNCLIVGGVVVGVLMIIFIILSKFGKGPLGKYIFPQGAPNVAGLGDLGDKLDKIVDEAKDKLSDKKE